MSKTRHTILATMLILALSLFAVTLSACSQTPKPTATQVPEPTPPPTDVPPAATPPSTAIPPTAAPTDVPPSATPPSTATPAPQLSFETATYQDESAGFELDYPASWTADSPQIAGSRGYIAQLTSWERTPGEMPDEIPEGGTMMTINVLLWDPKNALDQYVDHFKSNWSASGYPIVTEESRDIDQDWPAVQFLVRAPDQDFLCLLTTVGERYLVLIGNGDLQLLSEIARTLRPVAVTE